MYKKLLNILVISMIFSLMLPSQNALAFKSITRDQIIYDAIEFCPSELQKYLRNYLDVVAAGNHFADIHKRRSYAIEPYEIENIYHRLIKDIKEGGADEYNTAHAFGVIACFIAETISPDNFRTPQHLIPNDVKFDGYQEIGDVKSHITGLIENYRIPCRNKWNKEITEILYNVAVNEIVDYWTSAWEQGGFQAGTHAGSGTTISHLNFLLNSKAGV